MTHHPGRQRVIVYTRGGRDLPYATAYDDDQSADLLAECEERYGKGVNARVMYHDEAAPAGVWLTAP